MILLCPAVQRETAQSLGAGLGFSPAEGLTAERGRCLVLAVVMSCGQRRVSAAPGVPSAVAPLCLAWVGARSSAAARRHSRITGEAATSGCPRGEAAACSITLLGPLVLAEAGERLSVSVCAAIPPPSSSDSCARCYGVAGLTLTGFRACSWALHREADA